MNLIKRQTFFSAQRWLIVAFLVTNGLPISNGSYSTTVNKWAFFDVDNNQKQQVIQNRIVVQLINWLIPSAQAAIPPPPDGPILIVTSSCDRCGIFNDYYAEILRNEGFNEFNVVDISAVTASLLSSYDVVILNRMPVTKTQVDLFKTWVTSGGNLIAMRPDLKLASLLGLISSSGALSDGYLLVDNTKIPGKGIGLTGKPMQFHGTADRYTLNGAVSVATLFNSFAVASNPKNPAISIANVGPNGGHAAAFTYDLATSIIYTRQGNPAWAAQERDGIRPIRSDDKFFGKKTGDLKADWVDLDHEISVPQADEQQRLLANLIISLNLSKKPLPHFWYLPFGKLAAVVMTGDDHGNGGTGPRFNQFKKLSPIGCSVQNWECIRGTSYIFIETDVLSNTKASGYASAGFEIGLHLNTGCDDFTVNSLENNYTQQLKAFIAAYPSLPPTITERHHCIVWSDWTTAAQVMLKHGIRLDTSYYFYPPSWVQNRPGFFTGSAMPMRFADLKGKLIDVFNVVSHMTDESGQTYPFTIDTLLDRAIGNEGFYGVYTINAHTDLPQTVEATSTVNSAKSRNIPVVSSEQLLSWVDFKNNSSFKTIKWNGKELSFNVQPGSGANKVPVNGLQVLIPLNSKAGTLGVNSLKLKGVTIPFKKITIKGIDYAAFFAATKAVSGSYTATYSQ